MKKQHFDDLTKLGNNVALGVKKDDECVDLIMVKFYESSGYLIVCTNLACTVGYLILLPYKFPLKLVFLMAL